MRKEEFDSIGKQINQDLVGMINKLGTKYHLSIHDVFPHRYEYEITKGTNLDNQKHIADVGLDLNEDVIKIVGGLNKNMKESKNISDYIHALSHIYNLPIGEDLVISMFGVKRQ